MRLCRKGLHDVDLPGGRRGRTGNGCQKCREAQQSSPEWKKEHAAYMREYRASTRVSTAGRGALASQTPGEWQAAATAASAGLARKLGVDPDCVEWAGVTEGLIFRVLKLGAHLAARRVAAEERAWLAVRQAQTLAAPGPTAEARETVEAYRAGATKPARLAEVLGIGNEAARQRIRRYKKRGLLAAPPTPGSAPRSAPRSYLDGAFARQPSRVEKLQLMAAQSTSPIEADIARQKLEVMR